ncbi:tyrosine-type recombinase/integrase [Bosea sp. (in: a-proteobacteria)]|uniref:tyrosine-type recombinase/integrase n=1 Tax=Bosea sp. (in: a-proteobacteria) TaxID=1871050 RepID=UPI003F70F19D
MPALTDVKVRTAKPREAVWKLSDGGGLQLWITPAGGKHWKLAYRFGGKQLKLSVGQYPVTSLADARDRREEAKKLLARGIDPSAHGKVQKATAAVAAAMTFRLVAEELVEKKRREGRADATLVKTEWLMGFAYPSLGNMPISEITAPQVLDVLRKVEARGRLESARRLRSVMGEVFRYAIATARAEGDPTAALRGALVTPKVMHRAAVTDRAAFGAMLRAIDGYDGQPVTKHALQLMALLFPRPGELRMAAWDEFDIPNAVWTIPAERTKMRRAHRVPLPKQALAILAALKKETGQGPLAFPSVRSAHRPISENTTNAALRRLGYSVDEATSHGFRATASTLLNECGLWSADVIERALAHVEKDDVRRAYARGEHWDERVKMAQWWADELEAMRVNGPPPQKG